MRFAPGRHLGPVLLLPLLALACGVVEDLTRPDGLSIRRFTASPAQIASGATTTLSWAVDGADRVEIDQGVGEVTVEGRRQLRPAASTTYTLLARAGTSTATASIQVQVTASPQPSPSPGASPTPSPSPSPAASPSPSPSPSPTPSPSPSPAATCGVPVQVARGCTVTVTKPTALPAGSCIELVALDVNQACPVALGTVRSLSFQVEAKTDRTTLQWRRHPQNGDVLEPASGTLSGQGRSTVVLSDIVLDDEMKIQVLDGDAVLMAFVLRHW